MPYHLPLSSLLPPCPGAGPSQSLPKSAAVLGPLPATAPLHLAQTFLETADLPEFGSDLVIAPARVLIITGQRSEWHQALETEDEPWTRARIGDRRGLMRRVDVKYCPTAAHVLLLLHTVARPDLLILWDLLQFSYGQLNDYLKLVAAARSLDTQTILLEPRWTPDMSLAITPPGGGTRETKRVAISHALNWVLGHIECVEGSDNHFTLGDNYISKERCESSPWASTTSTQWKWQQKA